MTQDMRLEFQSKRVVARLDELSEKYNSSNGNAKYKYEVRSIIHEMQLFVDRVLDAYAYDMEAFRRIQQWQVDRLTDENGRLKAKLSYGLDVAQESGDDGIVTTIPGPTSERGYSRPWMLAELEELCFKLRHAGAEDNTSVSWDYKVIKAVVPFPEFILEPTKSSIPPPPPPEPVRPDPGRELEPLSVMEQIGIGAAAFVIAVLIVMGIYAVVGTIPGVPW